MTERHGEDVLIRGAHPIGNSGPRRHTFPAARVCAEPGCDTELSIYNPGARCALHAVREPLSLRAPRRNHKAELPRLSIGGPWEFNGTFDP